MTACVDFPAQLASIMDVLAKAAVADICKLVEDGYALLRLEVTRSQKENQMLKKRLRVMEMIGAARGGGREGPHACHEDPRAAGGEMIRTEGDQPSIPRRPFESPAGSGAWTVPECVEQPGDEEWSSETQFIKEEQLEVDLGRGDVPDTPEVTRLVGDDAGRAPTADSRTTSPEDTAEISGQPRTNFWEEGGANVLIKVEPPTEIVNHRPPCMGSERSEEKLRNVDYDYVLYERSSQADTFHTQEMVEVAAGADSHTLPIRSEHPARPTAVRGVGSSLGFFSVKPAGLMMTSMPLEVEVEICSAWKKDAIIGSMHSQQRHRRDRGSKGELVLGSAYESQRKTTAEPRTIDVIDIMECGAAAAAAAVESRLSPKTRKSSRKAGTKEKHFICTYCGKSFSCPNHLKTHRRIHTGEKPFSCNQCGKRFSDSSNVKRHQNTHTGNKPFICTLCGRGFSQSGCLVTHQRVHTGEKPFSCTQCGKRFSDSSNMKRHQNTHIGKKPCTCLD